MSRSLLHSSAPERPPVFSERPKVAGSSTVDNIVISSGQTAHRNGINIANGLVGAEIDLELARECAWQCARNVVTALEEDLGDLDRIIKVLRITVYVASAPGFIDQHLVADAATRYFHSVFGTDGGHARAAIGVAALPTNSPVEVEAVVEIQDA